MAQIERDGRTIAYEESGTGDPLVLLLHGWCASRKELAPLMQHLDRHVIAVDFRGHGDSSAGSGDFGSAELVDDTLILLDTLGVSSVVPVAEAHAGWIALELCRRVPDRISHAVLLDWIVLDPPPPFLGALAALQDEGAWEQARAGLFSMWRDGVPSEDVHRFVEDVMAAQGFPMWSRGGREIAAAYARHQRPLSAFAALPSPPKVLHLYAQPPTPEYLAAQLAFAADHDWFSVRRLDSATSHFPSLELPATVAACIEEHLRGVTALV